MTDRPVLLSEITHRGTGQILVRDNIEEAARLVRHKRRRHLDVGREALEEIGFNWTVLVPGDRGHPGAVAARLDSVLTGQGPQPTSRGTLQCSNCFNAGGDI